MIIKLSNNRKNESLRKNKSKKRKKLVKLGVKDYDKTSDLIQDIKVENKSYKNIKKVKIINFSKKRKKK